MRVLRIKRKLHYEDTNPMTRRYKILKDYGRYYLCECIQNGKALYRECFLKVDADEVIPIEVEKESRPRVGWYM